MCAADEHTADEDELRGLQQRLCRRSAAHATSTSRRWRPRQRHCRGRSGGGSWRRAAAGFAVLASPQRRSQALLTSTRTRCCRTGRGVEARGAVQHGRAPVLAQTTEQIAQSGLAPRDRAAKHSVTCAWGCAFVGLTSLPCCFPLFRRASAESDDRSPPRAGAPSAPNRSTPASLVLPAARSLVASHRTASDYSTLNCQRSGPADSRAAVGAMAAAAAAAATALPEQEPECKHSMEAFYR